MSHSQQLKPPANHHVQIQLRTMDVLIASFLPAPMIEKRKD